jgi:hypothetical protein
MAGQAIAADGPTESCREREAETVTDERPPASNEAPAPGTLAVLGAWVFVAGVALGLTQPLFVVAVAVTLVAGPTWTGLLFLLCVVLGLVAGAISFVGGRWFTIPVLVVSGSFALGLFAGNWIAVSSHVGFGADRPGAHTPSFAPASPVRIAVIHQAPASVVLRLDGVAGFTPNPGTERYTSVDASGKVVAEGVFGQWCYSGPDTEALASIETIDVGRVGDTTVWADLRLEAPIGLAMSMALPRVEVRLVKPNGQVSSVWTGQGQLEAKDSTTGRVAFKSLPDDGGASRATLTGELSWTCSPWMAGSP